MREEPFSPGGGAMGLDWGGMTVHRERQIRRWNRQQVKKKKPVSVIKTARHSQADRNPKLTRLGAQAGQEWMGRGGRRRQGGVQHRALETGTRQIYAAI